MIGQPPKEVMIDGWEFVPATWDGLLTILDGYYPAAIFTGASSDLGPRLVALLREVDSVRYADSPTPDWERPRSPGHP